MIISRRYAVCAILIGIAIGIVLAVSSSSPNCRALHIYPNGNMAKICR